MQQGLFCCPCLAQAGTTHSSNRGNYYGSDAYQAALQAAGPHCSMTNGAGATCYQSVLAARVNGIWKEEFLFMLPACSSSRPCTFTPRSGPTRPCTT